MMSQSTGVAGRRYLERPVAEGNHPWSRVMLAAGQRHGTEPRRRESGQQGKSNEEQRSNDAKLHAQYAQKLLRRPAGLDAAASRRYWRPIRHKQVPRREPFAER
jgi:hypothetical protein